MFAVTVIGQAPAPARTNEVFSLDSTKKGIWHLPEETPIAFVYNRQNYAVMLASPTDMVDFALGFSLSERVINTAQDIQNLEIQYSEKGVELFFKISPKRFQRLQLKTRRRNLAGSAGCGICGLQSTDILFDKLLPIDGPPMAIDKTALQIAMQGFAALQPLHQSTKSVHGAAWVST
ncbi:Sulfur carrier protein FdhD, partial [hydrothermal vent metagenome]